MFLYIRALFYYKVQKELGDLLSTCRDSGLKGYHAEPEALTQNEVGILEKDFVETRKGIRDMLELTQQNRSSVDAAEGVLFDVASVAQ